MRKYLGRHLLGHEGVKVWLDPAIMGGVARTPGRWDDSIIKCGEIIVGIKHPSFRVALDNTMHEALEYVMAKRGCRYERDLDMNGDSSNCLFIMSHDQFHQI